MNALKVAYLKWRYGRILYDICTLVMEMERQPGWTIKQELKNMGYTDKQIDVGVNAAIRHKLIAVVS